LERLRVLARHSRASLSAASGVSERQIANLEKGVHQPKLATARAIAGALDVPVAACWPGRFEDEPMPNTRPKVEVGIRYLLRIEAALADDAGHETLLADTRYLIGHARESAWPL
jgi:transcriptional regulator with XRE-family HTH domain